MAKSVNEIAQWLKTYVGKELRLDPQAIAGDARLFDLGLTSRQSVLLAGDLEDWLGVPLAPDVAWDHPSIDALATLLGKPNVESA